MRFKILGAIIIVLVIALSANKQASTKFSPPPSVAGSSEVHSKIVALMKEGKYDDALPFINSAIAEQKEQPTTYLLLSWLYKLKAFVYERRYHFHHALTAIKKAQQLDPNNQYSSYIKDWQKNIDRMQQERHLRDKYVAGKDKGFAKELRDKINIAYIYIDDRRNAKWSGKQRLQNQASLERVLAWYKSQAQAYGIAPPIFNVRYFVISSPKGIEKNWLRERSTMPFLAKLLVKQSGYSSFSGFMKSMRGRQSNSEVALVFHTNFEGRSFAMMCRSPYSGVRCPSEFVMLTERLNDNKYSWVLPQVQAHEMLHVFGAADLYNIKQSKDFAVTDIMNYYSSDIRYANISPLTAWAIGWHDKPITPFKVEN